MNALFKLLKNELLTLATLFFVITPFVGGMINDQRAPAGVQEFAAKAESIISGNLGSIGGFSSGGMVGSPINLGMSSGSRGGAAFYTSGAPIYMPES